MTHTVMFRKLKDTKNTTRYEEVVEEGDPTVIGTIYVQKWFSKGADIISVTLEKEGV